MKKLTLDPNKAQDILFTENKEYSEVSSTSKQIVLKPKDFKILDEQIENLQKLRSAASICLKWYKENIDKSAEISSSGMGTLKSITQSIFIQGFKNNLNDEIKNSLEEFCKKNKKLKGLNIKYVKPNYLHISI